MLQILANTCTLLEKNQTFPACGLNHLIDVVLLQKYVDKLQEDGTGPDGISSKLARITLAKELITLNTESISEDVRTQVEATKSKLHIWRSTPHKGRIRRSHERMAALRKKANKEQESSSEAKEFLKSKELLTDVQKLPHSVKLEKSRQPK